MSQAIKSGSGPYGNIPMQVKSIANDMSAQNFQRDCWLDLQPGESSTNPISDSSGESVFTIKQEKGEQRKVQASKSSQQQPQPAPQEKNYRKDLVGPQEEEEGERFTRGDTLVNSEYHDVEAYIDQGRSIFLFFCRSCCCFLGQRFLPVTRDSEFHPGTAAIPPINPDLCSYPQPATRDWQGSWPILTVWLMSGRSTFI